MAMFATDNLLQPWQHRPMADKSHNHLRAWRKFLKLQPEKSEEWLGRNRDYVYRCERGDNEFTYEVRELFAKAFGPAALKKLGRQISVDDLSEPPPVHEALTSVTASERSQATAEDQMDELYDADLMELLEARGYEFLRRRSRQLEAARRRANGKVKRRP